MLHSPGLHVPANKESHGVESPEPDVEKHAAGNGTQDFRGGQASSAWVVVVVVVVPSKEVPATKESLEVVCWVGNVIPLEACRVADVGGVAVMRKEGGSLLPVTTETLPILPVVETGKETDL